MDFILTKVIADNIKMDKLLIYNIVFHYHNEDIELLDYYLQNLNTMITNVFSTSIIDIKFNIIFFVSNLENFVTILRSKFIITNTDLKEHIIYENNTNILKTKYYIVKINNFNFSISVHNILSKPYKKLNSNDLDKTKINIDLIDIGTNSIGFKRYVSNIMAWNTYYKYKKDNDNTKKYKIIKVFLWQIDYGTFIGLPILLHSKINDKNITKLLKNKFNYLFESKKFLSLNNNILQNYDLVKSLEDNNIYENIYSNFDFYYFFIVHISTVINNFEILHFTALNFIPADENKQIKFSFDNKEYVLNSYPNKPKSYFDNELNKYINLPKSHYDKFYITDILLSKIIKENISRPITYNKNFTSFSEDLLYTSLIMKIKKIIISHPFLCISKCKLNNSNIKKINNKLYEMIYILLPRDDLSNSKSFEIYNFLSNIKHDVSNVSQDEEFIEFEKLVKKYESYQNGGNNKIICNIQNKINTIVYQNKYNVIIQIFNKYQYQKYFQNNIVVDNYNKLLILINMETNFIYYESIINSNGFAYNENYQFSNKDYKLFENTINIINKNEYSNEYANFIKEYIFNQINPNNSQKENKYLTKYLKYKQKYFNLKNKLINLSTKF